MSAKWEKLEGNEGVLTIEVEQEVVSKALDQAFQKVVKQVNVPGFRKGKVPRFIFEQRFGVESLYQDALDILMPEAYTSAIEETGISPVDQPEVDVEQIEKGKSLIFTAKVTVKPEVKLGEYKNLEIEAFDTTVTDEDVENELKKLQEQNAELVVKETGQVENGDTVVIDFEGFVDGEPFEGGKSENYSLEIGSNQFIPGFEEQIIGMSNEAEKDIEITFPEEYHAENLAGQPATFKVKLHEIKAKQLPDLDDEFAKDVDEEVESLEALKTKIKDRLTKEKEHEAEHKKRDSLIEQAVANSEIDVPQAMINTEIDRQLQEFEQNLQAQGINLDMYYQFSGQSEEALREQMKESGERRVRANLTLEAIAVAENIEISEEEVNQELERLAEMYAQPADRIKEMLGSLDGLKEDLKVQKAIDILIENSKSVA